MPKKPEANRSVLVNRCSSSHRHLLGSVQAESRPELLERLACQRLTDRTQDENAKAPGTVDIAPLRPGGALHSDRRVQWPTSTARLKLADSPRCRWPLLCPFDARGTGPAVLAAPDGIDSHETSCLVTDRLWIATPPPPARRLSA